MKTSHLKLSATVAALALALTACGAGDDKPAGGGTSTMSFLIDNSSDTVAESTALVNAFQKANPTIKVKTETRPGGTEGDNLIKTRLSTGEMSDVFWYNSGSLLQALNPGQSMLDLTGDPVLTNVQKSYLPVVSQDSKVYGVPVGSASAGGIVYNRKVYEKLGLQVPKTWADFMANSAKIKAAGIAPVVSTFKDSWTSQLLVLGDYYNVQAAVPTFAQDYTANKAKFATTPAAEQGFERLAQVKSADYLNKGYGSATADEGLKLLVDGKGAQYPILTFMIPPLLKKYPQAGTDLGFFAIPGDDATKNGATIWEPAAIYAAKNTKHVATVKKFLAFVASQAGVDAVGSAVPPTGPYRIEGAKLPANATQVTKDVQAYIDNNAFSPALEYISPVKGPSLEQITVAVGTGQTAPAKGAAQYDSDVAKQAKQLGLPGW